MDNLLPLYERVGFNYVSALKELLKIYTYKELADRIGYRSTGSITAVLSGRTPSHIHGETIWALYIDTFGRKPPLDVQKNANICIAEKTTV